MLATTIVNKMHSYEKFFNMKLQDYVNDSNVFVTKAIEALSQSITHFQYDDGRQLAFLVHSFLSTTFIFYILLL